MSCHYELAGSYISSKQWHYNYDTTEQVFGYLGILALF